MYLIGTIVVRCLLVSLIAMTILPLWRVGYWPVRLCDFFRLQIAIIALGLLITFLIVVWRTNWSSELSLGIFLSVLITGWQLAHIVQYTPLWPLEVSEAEANASSIRLTVVNLQVDNPSKQQVLRQLQGLEVDLLLLIEIDSKWAAALEPLQESYPHRDGVISDEGTGLMLWSRIPLAKSEVRYLVSDNRPSIFAELLVEGGSSVNYIGLHPLPPGLPDDQGEGRHDSRIRDAELMLVADSVAHQPNASWIVSGDFNDVAWSHTTRMFQRISGLKDPRVGRGFYNTYHANHPWMRFPIDQVFLSSNGRISEIGRFHPTGSDHFAITTTVSFTSETKSGPTASQTDVHEAEEMVEEGMQDAIEDGK